MKKGKISFFNNLPVWLRRTIAAVLIAALVGGGVLFFIQWKRMKY